MTQANSQSRSLYTVLQSPLFLTDSTPFSFNFCQSSFFSRALLSLAYSASWAPSYVCLIWIWIEFESKSPMPRGRRYIIPHSSVVVWLVLPFVFFVHAPTLSALLFSRVARPPPFKLSPRFWWTSKLHEGIALSQRKDNGFHDPHCLPNGPKLER